MAPKLTGVEYIVFQDAWDALHPQPPVHFGHSLHLVRSPNRYGVPGFYELHLWVAGAQPQRHLQRLELEGALPLSLIGRRRAALRGLKPAPPPPARP